MGRVDDFVTFSENLSRGTLYGERMNQMDFRVGKILRYGRTRTSISLDIYNAFNGNYVRSVNNSFAANARAAPHVRPTSIHHVCPRWSVVRPAPANYRVGAAGAGFVDVEDGAD